MLNVILGYTFDKNSKRILKLHFMTSSTKR